MTCKKGLGSSGGHLDGMVRAAFLRTEMMKRSSQGWGPAGETGEGGEGKPGKNSTKFLKQDKTWFKISFIFPHFSNSKLSSELPTVSSKKDSNPLP